MFISCTHGATGDVAKKLKHVKFQVINVYSLNETIIHVKKRLLFYCFKIIHSSMNIR